MMRGSPTVSELLLDMVRQASKTACFGDKIGVILETLLDTLVFEV